MAAGRFLHLGALNSRWPAEVFALSIDSQRVVEGLLIAGAAVQCDGVAHPTS